MKTALVMLALLAPAQALAESTVVSVQAQELDFRASVLFGEDQARSFRAMAHAIAVGQACQEFARAHSCEAGTPPRTRIRLDRSGRLRAVVPSDPSARSIVEACARADFDTSCTMWTCEFGRYSTEDSARSGLLLAPRRLAVAQALRPDRGVYAVVRWVFEREAVEPGSFVVQLPAAKVRPYARRAGLFFEREDAERAARAWSRDYGAGIRVVRQRVDGSVLEQAMTSEC